MPPRITVDARPPGSQPNWRRVRMDGVQFGKTTYYELNAARRGWMFSQRTRLALWWDLGLNPPTYFETLDAMRAYLRDADLSAVPEADIERLKYRHGWRGGRS